MDQRVGHATYAEGEFETFDTQWTAVSDVPSSLGFEVGRETGVAESETEFSAPVVKQVAESEESPATFDNKE